MWPDSPWGWRGSVARPGSTRRRSGTNRSFLPGRRSAPGWTCSTRRSTTGTPSLPDDDDNLGAFVPGLDARALWRLGAGVRAEGGLSGTAFSASGLRARTWTVRIGARWKASSVVEIGIGVEGGALSLTSEDPRQRNEIDLRGILPELSVALAF